MDSTARVDNSLVESKVVRQNHVAGSVHAKGSTSQGNNLEALDTLANQIIKLKEAADNNPNQEWVD